MVNLAEKAAYIDHTLLSATATAADISRVCTEAKELHTASVCVMPYFVPQVSEELKDSGVLTCVVVGFPLGAVCTEIKAEEARLAVEQGAEEVDMVVNLSALKSGDIAYVQKDITAVVEASKPAAVKVIIETCYLTEEEKVLLCQLSVKAGAAFVKTSTGFGKGGATAADVALMRKTVGDACGVKASGGIRSMEAMEEMINAGANRIGCSAGVKIMEEYKAL
ncbi:MAG: deoxyribose-phosphate aldolase [Firmicutes bacterium]|nr:deoxyribose-phosphate aldolase [Bacillota bacterium]